MMKQQLKIIIGGAGPAGCAAAISLSKMGFSPVILEQSILPKDKLCGGILSNRCWKLLESLISPELLGRLPLEFYSNVDIVISGKKIKTCNLKPPLRITERWYLDNILQKQVLQSGVSIHSKCRILKVEEKTILTSQGSMDYDVLLDCTGAVSRIRNQFFKNFRTDAFCLENRIGKVQKNPRLELHFSVDRTGYLWRIPKFGYEVAGAGALLTEKDQLIEDYQKYISQRTHQKISLKGAFVPFGNVLETCYQEDFKILFCGDSAGLADPFTGEGIYHALYSGIKAGEVCLSEEFNNFCGAYQKNIHHLISQISHRKKFRDFSQGWMFPKILNYLSWIPESIRSSIIQRVIEGSNS